MFIEHPRYWWMAASDLPMRRTIADAVEVLRLVPDFTDQSHAAIRIAPLCLPSSETVGLVSIEYDLSPEKTAIVSMPASVRFQGRRLNSRQCEYYDIFRLDKAIVDGVAGVQLADGTRLCAVELLPAQQLPEPSELDWRIVLLTVASIGAKEKCCPSLRDMSPPEIRDNVPDIRVIDCSKLSGLPIPRLERLNAYIGEQDPTLKNLSRQKIADALRKFGMRVPLPQNRQAAQYSATI